MKLFILSVLSLHNVADAAQLRQPQITELAITRRSSDDELLRQHGHVASKKKSLPPLKLTLANHKGITYTAPVVVGGQELQAIYDTGSFEVMTISEQCSACKFHATLHAYDNSSSKTFRKGDHDVKNHHFAGGFAKARLDYETVSVGRKDSTVSVKNMAFWQVLDTDMKVFSTGKANFTAIVGMGHRSKRPESDSESLVERTDIQKISICLMPGLANPGYITFNPVHDLANPAFRQLSVIGEDHWAVNLDQATTDLNGTPLHSCWVYGGQQSCVAIIDSGTSLIGVPPNAVIMIQTLIKRIKYDCSNLDELPDLLFVLDGKKFALPAHAYTVHFGMLNGKPYRCLPAFTDVSMSLKGSNVWILGMPFLRHFYTVFDREGPSIYVADQADNCEPDLGGHGAFIDASTFGGSSRPKRQLPTIADLSEATLPSWAFRNDNTQL
jgi:hypothetical protein